MQVRFPDKMTEIAKAISAPGAMAQFAQRWVKLIGAIELYLSLLGTR